MPMIHHQHSGMCAEMKHREIDRERCLTGRNTNANQINNTKERQRIKQQNGFCRLTHKQRDRHRDSELNDHCPVFYHQIGFYL